MLEGAQIPSAKENMFANSFEVHKVDYMGGEK